MLSLSILLSLSMAALLFGAFLGEILQNRGWGLAALKGMMASFIGGLLMLHLFPDAYAKLGPTALLFVGLGLMAMLIPERLMHKSSDSQETGRFFTAEMLWLGLILHEATDGIGIALASAEVLNNWHLAMVVIAHRIPVAAVVFWLFLRRSDRRQAWLRIAAMGAATILGALFSRTLEPFLSGDAIYCFYAFITGSFLHLVFHDFVDYHAHLERDRRAEFLAFMAGIALLFVIGVASGDGHDHENHEAMQLSMGFMTHFLNLIRETAPLLLLGLLISGLLHTYVPSSPIHWLQRGTPLVQSLKGMAFGLPLPICSCGVLPLFLSLARKGVPPACAVAFLIATPELGIDSFLLSVKLLGVEFTTVRLIVAMILPVVIALIAVRFLPDKALPAEPEAGEKPVHDPEADCCQAKTPPKEPEPEKTCCHKEPEPIKKSCCETDDAQATAAHQKDQHHEHGHAHHNPSIPPNHPPEPKKVWWRFAFINLVDDIFPFVFFGLLIAALAQTLWPQSDIGHLVGKWDVVVLALLGIPFYVCASASVPLALVLLQHGFSVGAVVVFLFAGPATNIATLLTTDKVYGKGMGLKLATTVFVVAILTGFFLNAVYTPDQLDIYTVHEHGWTWWSLASTIAIGGLTLASLYRNGPLHWISNVVSIVPGLSGHPH